jgi:hypothetical protein
MHKLACSTALALLCPILAGCETSCGEESEPVLWADGIVLEEDGQKTYLSTSVDGKWLHFPSYRRFRLRHGFGTANVLPMAWVSMDERPVAKGETDVPKEFAIASGNVIVFTERTENDVVVENGTCENDYYVLVKLTKLADE